MPAITILRDRLNVLFPAYIEIDPALVVRSAGPFFTRRETAIVPGSRLPELFSLRRLGRIGADEPMETVIPALAASTDQLELVCRTKAIRLTGLVIACEHGYTLAMNIVPEGFTIEGKSLTISDFSPTDPTVSALALIGMQRALLSEARETAIELARSQAETLDLLERTRRLNQYIAHDLSNYLSIISLNVANLERAGELSARHRVGLGVIDDAARQILDLTQSLQRFAGQSHAGQGAIELDAVIRSNLAFLGTVLPASIELTFSGNMRGATIQSGRTELVSCLANVILNCRDAMPGHGTIAIETRPAPHDAAKPRTGDWAAITIRDTGHGMDQATLARAFEPYFTTRPHGAGLGLPSIMTFARSIGGEVCIESAPGQGTSLHLHLPVSWTAIDIAVTNSTAPSRAATARGARVLVVEDEIHALEAVVEILEIEGYAPTPAANAAEAMTAMKRSNFDILLTDVVMPEISGIDLAIVAQQCNPGIAIVLMSGYCPRDELVQPHWHFLQKPLDISALTRTLAATSAQSAGILAG